MANQGKKITDAFWNNEFMKILETSIGIIFAACKQANVTPQSYYAYRRTHKKFADRVDDIKQNIILPAIEDTLLSKALKGDNKLLIFALRNLGNAKWNQDKYQEANQKERASRNIDQEYYKKIDEEQRIPTIAERMAANAYMETLANYEDANKNNEDEEEDDD